MQEKYYTVPQPIIDPKEEKLMEQLEERYKRLLKPGVGTKIADKAKEIVPEKVKALVNDSVDDIAQQDIYKEMMKYVTEGFTVVEGMVAKFSISEKALIKKVDEVSQYNEIEKVEEFCFVRGYELSKLVNSYKDGYKIAALLEGGATGAIMGLQGAALSIAASTLMCFRAVQQIAMHYGYDVKNDPMEMHYASDVFMASLNPVPADPEEISGMIMKVMLISELGTVKKAAGKQWSEVIASGTIGATLAQIRALENAAVKKAVEKAGKKTLEGTIYEKLLRGIADKLSLKSINNNIPYASIVLGALFDVNQMNSVLEYADVFYNMRFLQEKKERIDMLIGIFPDELIECKNEI